MGNVLIEQYIYIYIFINIPVMKSSAGFVGIKKLMVKKKEKKEIVISMVGNFNRFVLLRGMNLLELEEDCYFFSFFLISS